MQSDAMMEQVVVAAIATKTIEFLKNWKSFSFLSQHTVGWNRLLSVLISLAAGAGFTVAWTGDPEKGMQIVLGIPPLSAVVQFIVHAGFQFVSQEGIYQGMVKPPKADALIASGEVTNLAGRAVGTVEIKGVTAEAGSDAARAAAGEPVETKP